MNSIKSLIYTVISIVIFMAVAKFFFTLLPYFIVGWLIIYLVSKLKRFINNSGKSEESHTYDHNKESYIDNKDGDFYPDEVVDVDFEEVDK